MTGSGNLVAETWVLIGQRGLETIHTRFIRFGCPMVTMIGVGNKLSESCIIVSYGVFSKSQRCSKYHVFTICRIDILHTIGVYKLVPNQ